MTNEQVGVLYGINGIHTLTFQGKEVGVVNKLADGGFALAQLMSTGEVRFLSNVPTIDEAKERIRRNLFGGPTLRPDLPFTKEQEVAITTLLDAVFGSDPLGGSNEAFQAFQGLAKFMTKENSEALHERFVAYNTRRWVLPPKESE